MRLGDWALYLIENAVKVVPSKHGGVVEKARDRHGIREKRLEC
jgi:hypothetical protein